MYDSDWLYCSSFEQGSKFNYTNTFGRWFTSLSNNWTRTVVGSSLMSDTCTCTEFGSSLLSDTCTCMVLGSNKVYSGALDN